MSTDTGARPSPTAAPSTPRSAGRSARVSAGVRTPAAAAQAAVAHLLGQQDAAGWWQGELRSNVTMEAEDLLLRQFLGVRTAAETDATARWIRSQQRADGTWALWHDGPPDLSTSLEAYVALKLAGDDPDAAHMVTARQYLRAGGGIAATRVFTRIWLALFGQWPWAALPAMPPELILLPAAVPFNVYDWACWARQTVVPLTVVAALRPVRELGVDLAELHVPARQAPRPPLRSWTRVFQLVDRVLHVYERHPIAPLRRHAVARARRWVLARQEADGSWGGIQPPWVYSLLALHLLGAPPDDPAMVRGLAGLERFCVHEDTPDGPVRRLEACQSPVWDTVLAMVALVDAGVPGDHPAMIAATDFVLREEITVRGDWAVRVPGVAPGGWAFEFDNDGYPDTDDTAEVLLALHRVDHPDPDAVRAAIARGAAWLTGMQSRDGGWAAFDVDNTRELITRLPFCDFGAVIDPPSADVTAHVVEALCVVDDPGSAAVRCGVAWLLEHQEADGSWFGRWGVNHVYGTGAVVPALVAAGLGATHPAVRRAVAWLERHQGADGGWGEDLMSYRDPAAVGVGTATASQTAWALLALLAAGEHGRATRDGLAFLARTQRPDGGWDEEHYTGTGFPGDFSINYGLYRVVFPITALGRGIRALGAGVGVDGPAAGPETGPDGADRSGGQW